MSGYVAPIALLLSRKQKSDKDMVAPIGFEPMSCGPEPQMMDRYTTGLRCVRLVRLYRRLVYRAKVK